MLFVEQKIKFNKNDTESKMKIATQSLFCCQEKFLTFGFYLDVLYKPSEYILLHIKKHYFMDFSWLFQKFSKAFSVS